MKKISALIICTLLSLQAWSQLSIEECLRLAEENYPLIKKYDLVAKTRTLNLSDINKSWLPKITAYGQATAQNSVPDLPDALTGMLSQMGQSFEGLGHVQYKIGVDISQNIWDGGASKSRRAIERANSDVSETSLEVQMYAVREKVENLFFGILLMKEQERQIEASSALLEANLRRMQSMVDNGTATQSDADMIEAQLLTLRQQLVEARETSGSYRRMLQLYIATPLEGVELITPAAELPDKLTSDRPELKLLDARTAANNARLTAIGASVMPKIGLFAQAYYGYPGFNYFESMKDRSMSFNAMAGVKLSWNIDSFYTRKNARSKIDNSNADIETERELFLFNTELQTTSQQSTISSLRKVISDDARIVALRTQVRKTAESQLTNGIIDATDLLGKITDETRARLNASFHEIQLLQKIYQLKYTLNQ